MRAKSLDESQTEQIVRKATEIVQSSGGDFIRSGILIEKINQSLPKFKGYSLWKAIDYAVDNGFFEWVKYKGYRIAKHGKETIIAAEASRLYPLPSKDDGKESYYYPFVANWFLKKGNCMAEVKKGREWGMPDISVVRSLSSELLDEIELITVEVKRGWMNLSSITQTYGYSKLAHRCYLAADTSDELRKFHEHAERVGIGLLYIDPSNPEQIEELLNPPKSEPSRASLYEHLDRVFDLANCCFCGVWFKGVWRNKKEGIGGTKMIKRKRAFPGTSKIMLSVCPGCEDILRLIKPEDIDEWR